MDTWAPDAHDGMFGGLSDANATPGLVDPSAVFAQPDGVDMSQFPGAQLGHRLQNGNGMRTASPAFQNPAYQVNPVVPSKRPRPREDSMGASPRQTPGNMHLSRSQTPQQMAYAGFAPQQGGPPMQAPLPYSHLQQGGSQNATPSPTMPNQQFRPPPTPQRMQTGSPSPFPTQRTSAGPGMSPPPDHGGRVNAPQGMNMNQMAGMGFMPGTSMPPGYNQNFNAGPGMSPAGMPGGMPTQGVSLPPNLQQRQAEANRQYQMRLQMQQQQSQQQRPQQQQQAGPMGQMMGAGPPNPGMPGGGMRQQHPQQMAAVAGARQSQQDNFLRTVGGFNRAHGQPLNPNPVVCGRPINLMALYAQVMKNRGSKHVTMMNQWPALAQQFGFPQMQIPQAAGEMKMHYEKNLGAYEAAIIQSKAHQQHQQQQQQQQNQQQQQQGKMDGFQPGQMGQMGGPQMSPTKMMPPGPDMQAHQQQQQPSQQQQQHQQYMQQLQQQRAQAAQHLPEHSTPQQNNASLPTANGWTTPQADPSGARQAHAFSPGKKPPLRPEASTSQGPSATFPTASPAPVERTRDGAASADVEPAESNGIAPFNSALEHSTVYEPRVMRPELFGGFDPDKYGDVGATIAKLKPYAPDIEEMGLIDIRTLGMSIQSGIHGEMRYALDHLVKLSHGRIPIELEKSEDLIDILVDCAEAQVDELAEGAAEVSDMIELTPYEEVMRNCKIEIRTLQDVPEFGSAAWDLDRAADRLIAITTILRNLSFFELNHPALSSASVVKLLATTVRFMGTRHLLLRSATNTQDFMKDIITFLSNVSDKIVLPSRRAALSILHFILAFAPSPPPAHPVRFTPFNPAIHRYLPPAIDTLAKLIARDEPNRAYYKHLFDADGSSSSNGLPPSSRHSDSAPHHNHHPSPPPYPLLTRTFALAVSVVPDRTRADHVGGHHMDLRLADARRPYLTQGMLAAEILAQLAPGPASGVARAWLEAADGWAPSLLRLVLVLISPRGPQAPPAPPPPPHGRGPQRAGPGQQIGEDERAFGVIATRALAMLNRLGEKSCGEEDRADALPAVREHHHGANGVVSEGSPVEAASKGMTDGAAEQPRNGELKARAGVGKQMPNGGRMRDGDAAASAAAWKALMQHVIPTPETVLGALAAPSVDPVSLKQLCAFAALDG